MENEMKELYMEAFGAFDGMRQDTYKEITDTNLDRAMSVMNLIRSGRYRFLNVENPYTPEDMGFMAELANHVISILWVFIAAGNRIYENPDENIEITSERWFIVSYMLLLPEIAKINGITGGRLMYEISQGADEDLIRDRLERMEKEFASVAMCHPIFNNVFNFTSLLNMINDTEESKERFEQIRKTMFEPVIINIENIINDIKGLLSDINNGNLKVEDIDLSIFYKNDYRVEYTEEEVTDEDYIKAEIYKFKDIIPWASALGFVVKPDNVPLKAKLQVLAFLNMLIMDIGTYLRRMPPVTDLKEVDTELIELPKKIMDEIAEIRKNLGIIVDMGGNYIDPKNTNKIL